jgi:hypothetical protein
VKTEFFISIGFGVLFSCKKEEKQPTTDEMKSEVPQVEQPATEECYEYVQGKDTIQAKLLVQNNTVSGDLFYKLFEKDKNSGKVVGTISGDTLLADYTFMSEGTESTRQVVFLRKNKTLIEGYGESIEKEGKTVFKETKKLNFTSGISLNEIPCK